MVPTLHLGLNLVVCINEMTRRPMSSVIGNDLWIIYSLRCRFTTSVILVSETDRGPKSVGPPSFLHLQYSRYTIYKFVHLDVPIYSHWILSFAVDLNFTLLPRTVYCSSLLHRKIHVPSWFCFHILVLPRNLQSNPFPRSGSHRSYVLSLNLTNLLLSLRDLWISGFPSILLIPPSWNRRLYINRDIV